MIQRQDAVRYVAYVVDDAGAGRKLGADMHAIVRPGNRGKRLDQPEYGPAGESLHCYPSVLVGWQGEKEPVFVAVHSYLDVRVDDDEARSMATDYLEEIGFFAGESREPDYLVR